MTELTQEYVKSRFDYCDGCLYWKPRLIITSNDKGWNTRYSGKKAGCVNPNGYLLLSLTVNGKKRRFWAHRVIWLLIYGHLPKDEIDHINGVRSDNRLENLRDVTRDENRKNHKIRKDNLSGVMGVSWFKARQKWRSYIHVNRKQVHLGFYLDMAEACHVRKAAELKYGFHANHGRLT